MEQLSYLRFAWSCISTAYDKTLAFFHWDLRTMLIGITLSIAGYLIFYWRRGASKTRERVEEDWLLLILPISAFVVFLFVLYLCKAPYEIYKAEHGKYEVATSKAETAEKRVSDLGDEIESLKQRGNHPINAECWIKNYAAPALPAPPAWGIATVFCNTTIKPPYSIELNYDQLVQVGPFTFPVGSEKLSPV